MRRFEIIKGVLRTIDTYTQVRVCNGFERYKAARTLSRVSDSTWTPTLPKTSCLIYDPILQVTGSINAWATMCLLPTLSASTDQTTRTINSVVLSDIYNHGRKYCDRLLKLLHQCCIYDYKVARRRRLTILQTSYVL